MANDIFNFKRFGKYLASDLRGCVSNFGVTFAVAVAAPLISYFFFGVFHLIFTGTWGSMPLVGRISFFIVIALILFIAMPAGCYGKLTDKHIGSQFLLLPVSSFEKTASMILITCIIAPVVFIAGYGALDALLCLVDPSQDTAILSFSYLTKLFNISGESIPIEYHDSFAALWNPILYADDFVGIVLIFLLGALWFKKGKVSKTIIAFILFNMVISMVSTPIIFNMVKSTAITNENVWILFDRFDWVFRHLALCDTINDTVGNLVLATLVFLRVRTLKH